MPNVIENEICILTLSLIDCQSLWCNLAKWNCLFGIFKFLFWTLRPFRNYIPSEIYQYGDVVYTKVIPLTYKSKASFFISIDRARSWTKINFRSDFENKLDKVEPFVDDWPMVGYKDRMVSYCVGYKDGKRQDLIKVIRLE